MSTIAVCPPALPPASAPILVSRPDDTESVRLRNLKVEGQIRTIGRCGAVWGAYHFVLLGLSAMFMIFAATAGGAEGASDAFRQMSVQILFAAIPAAVMVGGIRLNRLRATSGLLRFLLCLLLCLSVFPFGLGLGIAGFVLMGGKSGREILSPEYTKVLERTPSIRSRASWVIPAFYGLLIFVYSAILLVFGLSSAAKIAEAAASQG